MNLKKCFPALFLALFFLPASAILRANCERGVSIAFGPMTVGEFQDVMFKPQLNFLNRSMNPCGVNVFIFQGDFQAATGILMNGAPLIGGFFSFTMPPMGSRQFELTRDGEVITGYAYALVQEGCIAKTDVLGSGSYLVGANSREGYMLTDWVGFETTYKGAEQWQTSIRRSVTTEKELDTGLAIFPCNHPGTYTFLAQLKDPTGAVLDEVSKIGVGYWQGRVGELFEGFQLGPEFRGSAYFYFAQEMQFRSINFAAGPNVNGGVQLDFNKTFHVRNEMR